MLKNLKKAAAIVLSFAMAVQFDLADSYYVNAVEEPVEPQQEETKTTTTTPQEQEEVPTTEEETPQQQQEEGQQQPAVEEEQPAAEEAQPQPQPQPVEQAEVKVSYVKEDGTDLMESVTATYDVGYRLDQDTNVFKEAHEAFEFEYAFVNGNKENKITKDQVKASGLTVTSDMTSLTLVYKSTATQNESKDKKTETANLSGEKEDDSDSDSEEKNISVASDTDTTRTIKVGETITLTSRDVDKNNYYYHNWTVEDGSKVKLNKTNGISITVKGLQEGTTIVTDTYSWVWEQKTKEYTITVNAAVTPTDISISGANTVKQFQTTQLTANLTPADANGKVTWTSSNEQILSVDENGLVTGNRQGSATITASVQGANNKTLSATKTIEVVKNESPSGNNRQQALVYYLKDPTKDANSNGSDQWGPSSLGTAIVNVEGATWTGGKNCFDNVDQRVVSWPNGTNVISRSNNAWDLIFDAYKASIESQLGVTITKDDVEEISLVPAKISRNNGTNPDMHLDCNVNIKCKSVALVKYYLFDANGTNWEMLGSKNYLVKDESTTQPSDVTNKDFPTTKTVNGVTYTFSGWYTDQSLTTPAPSFPAKVTGSVTYYAKYVAGYQVSYNLAGGKFSDGSTSATEKHNVDTTVVVKNAPTRKGYKFTSWKVEGLDGTTTINSGESFTMPNGNVTLTANWEKKDINDYVTLTTKDVEEKYNGQSHAAGEATAVAKAGKENEIGKLTVEYQKADGKWTTNREEITAKDVSDSKTVNVRVSSDDCLEYVTGTEKLTITKRAVKMTSKSASKAYDGTALTKPDVKVSGDGFVKGEVSDIKATGSVTTVSEGEVTNTIIFTKETDYKDGNYTIFKEEGKLSITPQSIDPGTDPEKPNPDYTGAKVNSPNDGVYDGNEHKWIPTVTDKADKKLEAGTDYTVEYSTKNFKDVGTIDVTITGIGNYTGTVTRTYKITPKSVTVTADNKTKVFGETDPKLTAKVDGTLGNDTVDYKLSRETGEAAGKYEITVKGDKLQGNYTVTYVAGTLTITSQSIDPGTDPEKPNPDYTGAKVNSPSDKVYDGKEHKWSPTVTDKADKKLKAGTDYTVEYSTSDFTNVGTIEVTITGIGNYSGTVKRSYKVTPKEYTVTTDSATKTYSGTALTAGGKVEGIVSGETVEFTTTGSQTEVGTSKNTYELVWKSAKATNYTLAKESIGKLTVKAKSIIPDDKDTPESDKTGITVSEPSDSKYDGKEHREVLTVTDTKTGKELVAGTDYSVTYSSDLVNAGTVKVTVAGLGNYSGSFAKTYKITKRSVTLTSATVSKVYDGSALTNTSIAVSGDGFVEGEGASYEVTGSQTVVGNSANSFEYKLNEKTLASNYNITKVVGTLTITAAPAPVTPATPSTPSSTTSTTPRTPSAPQVTTPAETVEKETTPKAEPKKEEKVEEEYTPKASPQYYWALINLICAILTVLFGLLLLISKRHKDEDDDEDDDETKQQTNNDDEEKEQEKKRGLFTRVLAVLIAIVSVVFFLVTEDLSLPWTWTDQWTIWMVVIGLVQIVVFFVGRKWKNVDDDEDEEEAQQA